MYVEAADFRLAVDATVHAHNNNNTNNGPFARVGRACRVQECSDPRTHGSVTQHRAGIQIALWDKPPVTHQTGTLKRGR